MRKFMIIFSILLTLTLCGCQRNIESPSDEIVMYRWRSQLDSGNEVSLTFEGDNASFVTENEDFRLSVSGYCAMYDDRFIISDQKTRDNYTFSYQLFGDHIELTYGDGTIVLQKDD